VSGEIATNHLFAKVKNLIIGNHWNKMEILATRRQVIHFQPDQGLRTSANRRIFLLGILLVVATVALYYPVKQLPFMSVDDRGYVTENINIKYGLSSYTVKWAFMTFREANWHPLTWLSHALDYQFFLLNSAGHHETNLLLHVLNVVLLFWVLLQATGFAGRSAMVAALFALHPINVETVAWVAERKNLLSMLFFLLALGAYRWYAREPRVARYAVVAFLYAFGLMSKPQVITFPFVLLLWDYWPLRRMFPEADEPSSGTAPAAIIPPRSLPWLVLEKVPLLALSAASAVITMRAQEAGGAMGGPMDSYPLSIRVGNAILSYPRYVEKAFWPSHLAIFYPHPWTPWTPLNRWHILAAFLVLLAISALITATWRRQYPLVGWLWFLGTLVPMIGFVQVGNQGMADRYAYLPLIGLFIMVCWGVADWADSLHVPTAWQAALGVAVLLALMAATHRQLSYWTDDVTLWSHASQVTSGNDIAELVLGTVLLDRKAPEQALPHLRASAAIYPLNPMTYYYIGLGEQQRGNLPEAIQQYKKVIRMTQNDILNASLRVFTFREMAYAYRDLGDSPHYWENLQAAKDGAAQLR
jgi:hypothetical protein